MKTWCVLSILVFTSLFFAAGTAPAQAPAQPADAAPTEPPVVHNFDPAAIDNSVDPCVDFYQYACGNWIKNNTIPADQSRWSRSFSVVEQRNQYLLWQLLDTAAKDPKTPLQKQYGDYYAACMDTGAVEKAGLTPLEPALKAIAQMSDAKQLASVMAGLENRGMADGFFRVSVEQDQKDSSQQIAAISQGGLSLPGRISYLDPAPHFATIRTAFVAHVTTMFTLAGDTPEAAAREAAAVMEIETAMAKAFLNPVEMRSPASKYHIDTLAELDKLAPDFDWTTYFSSIGIGHFDTLNVATPNYFKVLSSMIQTEPLDTWKSYMRWHVLHGKADLLPKPFFDANFDFFTRTLTAQQEPKPRWEMCTAMTNRALGDAVGQDWVKQNFPPAARARTEQMVTELEKALHQDIETLPWMSDETKKAAEQKLALIRQKIGYPDKWRDYSSIAISPTELIENTAHVAVFDRSYAFAKLGKPVDEKAWAMTPPTVNAYYDPPFNDINFPAGILQPPFFDFKADPAVNFGGIGAVIGHEMTHGFDDHGSQYDGYGNLKSWWTAEDRKAFDERESCLASEYSGFVAAPAEGDTPARYVNGRLTLGENTADNGGMRIAYMALEDALASTGKSMNEKIGGFTEAQRYFLTIAQKSCNLETPAAARRGTMIDPHSPGKWRVNGSLQNFEEFGKAFSCKKGQPMYPLSTCRVW